MKTLNIHSTTTTKCYPLVVRNSSSFFVFLPFGTRFDTKTKKKLALLCDVPKSYASII